MPKKIMIETLFQEDKKKYLSIVFFTIQSPYKKEWLRLCHYRYALQKNHGLSPSFQKSISATFDRKLEDDYKNPFSPIKKCFNSKSNLIDHLNKLVEIELLEKKWINGEYHYRLKSDYKDKLFYAFECAWFNSLIKKLPYDVLRQIRNHIESNFKDELKKYNALFYSIV